MNQQEDKLQGEILEDAKTKAERLIARAKNDADAVILNAQKEAEEKHRQRIQDAQQEAQSQTKTILAGIQMEISRRWLAKREQCIDNVLGKALEDACRATPDQRRQALMALAREAIRAIGNQPCKVTVSQQDQDIATPQWLADLAGETLGGQEPPQYTVTADQTMDGGIRLQTVDGRRTFDNSFQLRLSRMKDQLRLLLVNGK